MNLETYIKRLEQASDDKLKNELGISDNMRILIKSEMEFVNQLLTIKCNFLLDETFAVNYDKKKRFDYLPGTVRLQLTKGSKP